MAYHQPARGTNKAYTVGDICGLLAPLYPTEDESHAAELPLIPFGGEVGKSSPVAMKLYPIGGTSAATPQVAAVAALVVEKYKLRGQALRDHMIATGTPIPTPTGGRDFCVPRMPPTPMSRFDPRLQQTTPPPPMVDLNRALSTSPRQPTALSDAASTALVTAAQAAGGPP